MTQLLVSLVATQTDYSHQGGRCANEIKYIRLFWSLFKCCSEITEVLPKGRSCVGTKVDSDGDTINNDLGDMLGGYKHE